MVLLKALGARRFVTRAASSASAAARGPPAAVRAVPIRLLSVSKGEAAYDAVCAVFSSRLQRYTNFSETVFKPNPKGAAADDVAAQREHEGECLLSRKLSSMLTPALVDAWCRRRAAAEGSDAAQPAGSSRRARERRGQPPVCAADWRRGRRGRRGACFCDWWPFRARRSDAQARRRGAAPLVPRIKSPGCETAAHGAALSRLDHLERRGLSSRVKSSINGGSSGARGRCCSELTTIVAHLCSMFLSSVPSILTGPGASTIVMFALLWHTGWPAAIRRSISLAAWSKAHHGQLDAAQSLSTRFNTWPLQHLAP